MAIVENSLEISIANGQLSLVGQLLPEGMIPVWFAEKYGADIVHLDLSETGLKNVTNLEKFTKLGTLILDSNELDNNPEFPEMLLLETLWINNNKITDLGVFLENILKKLPNLTYVSFLKNPACPNSLISKEFADDDYQRYRYFVLYKMPKLKFLDARQISVQERNEAKRVGKFTAIVRPDKDKLQNQAKASPSEEANFSELPNDLQPEGKGAARFGYNRYIYQGRQSEGNRFILNSDL